MLIDFGRNINSAWKLNKDVGIAYKIKAYIEGVSCSNER